MPLVDDGEFEHNNEGADQIIKVIVAVVGAIEHSVVEGRVATEFLIVTRLVVTMEINEALERLHADDGEGVIQNLKMIFTVSFYNYTVVFY